METLKNYVNWKLAHSDKVANAEGYPLVMENCKTNKRMKQLEVYGDCMQSQTPSPDNPSEIQSVGDLTTKNLFDKDNALVFNGYFSGGKIVNYNPTASDMAIICIDCKPNTSYTISRQIQSKRFRFASSTMPPGTGTIVNIFASYDNQMNGIITTGENDIYLYVWFYNKSVDIGYTYQEIMNGIQIEEGSIATEYEPYHKYKIPITLRGKNLLPYPYIFTTKTINGVTFTDNGDGSITLNGTTTLAETGVDDFTLVYAQKFKTGTYTLSGCPKTGAIYTYRLFVLIRHSDGKVDYANDIGNNSTFKITDTDLVTINIRIGGQIGTVSNLTFKPQLELDSTATEYEPYIEPITQNIYFDEPLRKIEDYADYIDFKNKKVVRSIFSNSLNINSIYWKSTNVVRFDGFSGTTFRGVPDSIILSYIFLSNKRDWNNSRESIFQHSTTYYNWYWSIYWSRLGLTYDGTNVYRIDGTEQIPLTNSEIISIANEWISTLSDRDKTVYRVRETPIEEDISCQLPKILAKTTIIEVDTSLLPSNIKGKYIIK